MVSKSNTQFQGCCWIPGHTTVFLGPPGRNLVTENCIFNWRVCSSVWGSLGLYTVCLTPSRLRRGAGGAGDPKRCVKLQALVYDILPSTIAVFTYTIGSRKLSAKEQFFVGAQTVVSLLQTTQIKQGVSFIAANKVYNSTNKTTIV